MSIIQKQAEQLITSARAISKQIYEYQEKCKSEAKQNDKEFIDSKFEELCSVLPNFRSQKSTFIDAQNRVKTALLLQEIVPKAYSLSASENYIEDQDDVKIEIPLSYRSIQEVGKDKYNNNYEPVLVHTVDEKGEFLYDQVDEPAVMIPKILEIDTDQLSANIMQALNTKMVSLKKNIEEQIQAVKSNENQGSLELPKTDIQFEAAKMLSEMLKNNGVLSVTSQATGETINLDLTHSLKLSSAKDRYSDLTQKFLNDLLEANGVLKVKVPVEVISKLPNGETLKTTKDIFEFRGNAMATDFFQTLLTNQNVTDASGKKVSLIDRWLSIAGTEYNKKIESWLKENSAYTDSAENSSKFFNFFMSNVDEAQKQIHATYFPTTDPSKLGINTINNPFNDVAPQYDSINQFNPMSQQYQGTIENNQLPQVQAPALQSSPPVGGIDLYNNTVAQTQQQDTMSLKQLTDLL